MFICEKKKILIYFFYKCSPVQGPNGELRECINTPGGIFRLLPHEWGSAITFIDYIQRQFPLEKTYINTKNTDVNTLCFFFYLNTEDLFILLLYDQLIK